jgi:hypothetical protein
VLTSCALKRPCSEAGDTSWEPPVKNGGDRTCHQTQGKDGRYVNHGKYIHKYKNGSPAVVGFFKDGKKDGVWEFFDEKGEKKIERFYRDGVETSPGMPPALKTSRQLEEKKK